MVVVRVIIVLLSLLLLLGLLFLLRPEMTSTFSLNSEANLSFLSLPPSLARLRQVWIVSMIFSFFSALAAERRDSKRRSRRKRKKKKTTTTRRKIIIRLSSIIKYIKFILSVSIYLFRSGKFTNRSSLLVRSLVVTNQKTASFFSRSISLSMHGNARGSGGENADKRIKY